MGRCERIPAEYHNAYIHEKEIIVTYTERIQSSSDYKTQGQASAWLGIPISDLRNEVGTYEVGIPESCYHSGKLPDEIRNGAQEIPLLKVDEWASARSTATNAAYAVVATRYFSELYICFTDARGERGVERAGWSGVEGRHAWAYPVMVVVFPLAVAVDVATAPIQIPLILAVKDFESSILGH
jgi:hypothetical protein